MTTESRTESKDPQPCPDSQDSWNSSGPSLLGFGAEGGTRTPTGFPTTPSRWRVCQFHHFGTWKAWQCDRKYLTEEKAARLPRISLSRAFWPHPSNSRLLRVRAFFHSTPDREQLPPGSCRPADSASASL